MTENKVDIYINILDYRANEAYKALRTNIEFCGDDVRVISFTSCTPNEGKTSVSLNVAKAFVDKGKKVLIIDADLRKSVMIGRYRVGEVKYGLTHYLSGQNEMEEVIYQTNIKNLDIVFCGSYSPNPAELLGHIRFKDMINNLRSIYDYIIVDTPPLGSVIDGAIVAKVVDGVIMVIESNSISYKFAQHVKEQLDKANCRILGTVLNKVPMDKKGYYSKYYGKYYG